MTGDIGAFFRCPQTSVAAWLGEHAPEGARIGFDPWLQTRGWVAAARAALMERGGELIAEATNPVDAVWPDQPAPSMATLVVHPDDVAGQSSAEKRQQVADWLTEKRADAVVLSALDSIAWTFNLRGQDVKHTPVFLAYALLCADGTALARAVFPAGTRGFQLDALARQFLWPAGMDYAHGTGHGVGSYLSVHEGPQRIARTSDSNEPLLPGMILSNEPGYYKLGEYGIRIENLVLVVERQIAEAECAMLGFETLTFVPIDVAQLTIEERTWIDNYHAEVGRIIAPQLAEAEKEWLSEATRPLC